MVDLGNAPARYFEDEEPLRCFDCREVIEESAVDHDNLCAGCAAARKRDEAAWGWEARTERPTVEVPVLTAEQLVWGDGNGAGL